MFALLSTVVTLGACIAYVMANSSSSTQRKQDEINRYELNKKYEAMKLEQKQKLEATTEVNYKNLGLGE